MVWPNIRKAYKKAINLLWYLPQVAPTWPNIMFGVTKKIKLWWYLHQAPPTGRLTRAATTQAQRPTTPSAREVHVVCLRYHHHCHHYIHCHRHPHRHHCPTKPFEQEESRWSASGIIIRLVLQKFFKLGWFWFGGQEQRKISLARTTVNASKLPIRCGF